LGLCRDRQKKQHSTNHARYEPQLSHPALHKMIVAARNGQT
jgi:hypothetical protein